MDLLKKSILLYHIMQKSSIDKMAKINSAFLCKKQIFEFFNNFY